jgi:GTP-binding protein HflX
VVHGVELVVMDCALSPIQQRNLEKAWNAKVLDRTGLILEIFGRRATTKEGALQVELAHLNYQRSRLVRSWTHLERQRGGFGFLGGPGETQIEADRRLIGERITRIEAEIKKVAATRRLHRAGRKRVPYRIVALVGYTNAGKSTLFNTLTRSDVMAEDLLFATLDPTMRGLTLPSGRNVILSDTVGFIADLPVELVAAFRATLEEVLEAQIILHVRDAAHEETEAQKADVLTVLTELGIGDDDPRPKIEILNKIDLLEDDTRSALLLHNQTGRGPVAISALSGDGLHALLARLDEALAEGDTQFDLTLDAADGASLAWAYRHGRVMARRDDGQKIHLTVSADPAEQAQFAARFPPSASKRRLREQA